MTRAIMILLLLFGSFQSYTSPSRVSDQPLSSIMSDIKAQLAFLNIVLKHDIVSITFGEDFKENVYASCDKAFFNRDDRYIIFNINYKYLLDTNLPGVYGLIAHEAIHCLLDYRKHDEDDLVMTAHPHIEIFQNLFDRSPKALMDLLSAEFLKYAKKANN